MNELQPFNQNQLFGLDRYITELINLYDSNKYPNKLLLSGQKGLGKSTLAYHFINYVLSKDEIYSYDKKNYKINIESSIFKTILNKSNPNLIVVDVNSNKKFIDINQIRDLILKLNKSSFNNKPRFVLIDNIEFLNSNSINALLKILEEPNQNINFILINNNKKILKTLLSRCINYNINLTNKECLEVANCLLNDDLNKLINQDLLNYYISPGKIYDLVKFSKLHDIDLINLDLKKFLQIIIDDNHYKKDTIIRYIIFDLIEFYFIKLNISFSKIVNDKYVYFLKRISDTKIFNLDEESLFMEFREDILSG